MLLQPLNEEDVQTGLRRKWLDVNRDTVDCAYLECIYAVTRSELAPPSSVYRAHTLDTGDLELHGLILYCPWLTTLL